MTTIDLHPEEMLDAARRGTLSADAEADLAAHLGRCAACRLSLSLPEDLRAESAVTASDQALLASMVSGAMLDEPRVAAPADLRTHRSFSFRRMAVALALLLVGGSAGGVVWAQRETLARTFEPIIVQLRHGRGHVAAHEPRARHALATPVAPQIEVVAPPVEAPRAEVVAPPARTAHARVESRAPSESAEAIFTDANRARRAGQYGQALRRYTELRRAYPGSREEITARVVVGNLLLAEGSAKDGLASFDSYLAANPDGTLSEEARVGRALALMRLGRRAEEREAWTQLVRKHPDSVQGARARARLAELR